MFTIYLYFSTIFRFYIIYSFILFKTPCVAQLTKCIKLMRQTYKNNTRFPIMLGPLQFVLK